VSVSSFEDEEFLRRRVCVEQARGVAFRESPTHGLASSLAAIESERFLGSYLSQRSVGSPDVEVVLDVVRLAPISKRIDWI
jgi:hypothetical protein